MRLVKPVVLVSALAAAAVTSLLRRRSSETVDQVWRNATADATH